MARETITAETLRELLAYDPDTGRFTWRHTSRNKKRQAIAGYKQDGYIRIQINGQSYAAHNLAWLYVHGEWPSDELDHRNLDGFDNSITNLRQSDRVGNCANRRTFKNNTSGFKGVSWHAAAGKWVAKIGGTETRTVIGFFDSRVDAARAYERAAMSRYRDFARMA